MTSCQRLSERRAKLPVRRVLCADDEPAFLELAMQTLGEHFPVEVVGWAKNGLEVLALAEELAPDLVLMDFNMPGINGLHATAWLKARPAAPKVVLVTGFEALELQRAARAAGADGFCGKTALAQSLVPLLGVLWPTLFFSNAARSARPGRAAGGLVAEPGHRRSPVRTLIVDDSVLLCQLVSAFLERCGGFQVVGTAGNGHQALELVRALKPELVLMDWRMPGMDGLEATRRLKAQPGCPLVFFMPLEDDPVLRAEARAAGADGFIGKQELPSKLPWLLEEHFSAAPKPGSAPSRALAS